MNQRTIGALGAILIAASVTACASAGVTAPTNRTGQQATPAPTIPTATDEPIDEPIDETAAPDPGTYLAKVGEAVEVTADGDPYLEVTVSKPSFHKSYGSGYLKDTPKKGYVYLEVFVTYKALTAGASYNQFDWALFVDDTAIDDWAFASSGPEPGLNSGDLPKGRVAKGWLLYEVPASGKHVVLSYGGGSFTNDAPVFEVKLR